MWSGILRRRLGWWPSPDLAAGLDANLHSILALMETATVNAPGCRIINASSVAVYGSPVPKEVHDYTLPNANSSYAAQKLVSEILLDDFTRRGHLDGLSLRLSGVMARSPGNSSTASAFLNNVFHAAREGGRDHLAMQPRHDQLADFAPDDDG
jgi:nucleoside-diphosphate-sugar epimerase